MNVNKVGEGVNAVVKFVDKLDLKIDEKIAVCRAAGDVFQQVIVGESMTVMLKESMKNYIIANIPKG